MGTKHNRLMGLRSLSNNPPAPSLLPTDDSQGLTRCRAVDKCGVRNFETHPINKVPNRHNATGDCHVNSDTLAWLNKLPPIAPRNATLKFYDLDPEASNYAEALKAQGRAMAACARLGMNEAAGDPEAEPLHPAVTEIMSAVATLDAPSVKCERRTRGTRAASSLSRSERDSIRRAFILWLSGRAHLDRSGTDFYVRSRASNKSHRASWSSIVRAAFPTQQDFEAAANAWRSPKNERTIARHG